eukprot:SAG11_NODE_2039_length_3892_cov_1.839705_4_plen_292_part_00
MWWTTRAAIEGGILSQFQTAEATRKALREKRRAGSGSGAANVPVPAPALPAPALTAHLQNEDYASSASVQPVVADSGLVASPPQPTAPPPPTPPPLTPLSLPASGAMQKSDELCEVEAVARSEGGQPTQLAVGPSTPVSRHAGDAATLNQSTPIDIGQRGPECGPNRAHLRLQSLERREKMRLQQQQAVKRQHDHFWESLRVIGAQNREQIYGAEMTTPSRRISPGDRGDLEYRKSLALELGTSALVYRDSALATGPLGKSNDSHKRAEWILQRLCAEYQSQMDGTSAERT